MVLLLAPHWLSFPSPAPLLSCLSGRAMVLIQQALRSQSARKAAPALARGLATPAFTTQNAGGVKVASSEDGSRTSSISVVVKSGARYEPAPGVAHVLKNSVFKVRSPAHPRRPDPGTGPLTLACRASSLRRVADQSGRMLAGHQQAQPDPVGARDGGARRCPLDFAFAGAPCLDGRVSQG